MSEQPPQPKPVQPRERVSTASTEAINAAAVGHPPATAKPDEAEVAPRLRPSIWVGSWLDYNNGILHGDWIPADRDDTDVWADIQAILARSPTTADTGEVAEDWGIFDFENFGPLRIGEQETVDRVTKVARGIAEYGLAFAAWADVTEDEDLLDQFAEAYLGHYDSVKAYAEQYVDDLGYEELLTQAVGEQLRPYIRIDTELLARDLQAGGDIDTVSDDDGGVWIFDSR